MSSEAGGAQARLLALPALSRIGAILLVCWVVALPLIYVGRLNQAPALVAALLISVSLLLAGWATRPTARRRDALAILGVAVVLMVAVEERLLPGIPPDVIELVTGPFQPAVSDAARVTGGATLCALAVAVLWLIAAVWGREVRVPLAVLTLPALVGALQLVVPGGRAGSIIPCLLLLLAALLVGRWITRLVVGPSEADRPIAWISGCCVGLGTITLVWLALGSLRLFTPPALALAVVILLAPAWSDLPHLPSAAKRIGRWLLTPVALRANAAPVAAGLLCACVAPWLLMAALAPDLMADSVNQHLAVAATYAHQGGFDSGLETNLYYWQVPVQVIFAGLIAWSGPIAAQVFHYACGVLVATAVGILTAHLTGRPGTGLVAAAIVGIPSIIWWLAPTGYTDLAITFYFVATVCALVRWVETGQRGWLVLAGLAAGVAVPAKLTNCVLAALLVATIVACEWRAPRAAVGSLLACGLPALLIWGPWPIRSFLLAGNPVFPWFNQVFHSPLVEPVAVFAGVKWGVGTGLDGLLRLPLALTFEPEKFVESGELGVQFLALCPLVLLLLRARRRSSLGVIALAALLFGVMWAFALLQNLRYFLPAVPLLAVLIAVGYAYGSRLRFGPWLSAATVAALYVAVIGNAMSFWDLRTVSGREMPYKLVLGWQSEGDYLTTFIPGYRALQHLNVTEGYDAQVWAPSMGSRLYSHARYYSSDAFIALPMLEPLLAATKERDPTALADDLRSLGFTHLLVNGWLKDASLPESKRPTYLSPAFLDHHADVEYADNGVVLYRLLAAGQQPRVRTSTEQIENGDLTAGRGDTPAGWTALPGPAAWDRSGAGAQTPTPALGTRAGVATYYSDLVPAIPGGTYWLKLHARAEQPDVTGIFQAQFLDEEEHDLSRSWVGYYPDTEVREFDLLDTAPESARYVRVMLGTLATDSYVWVSDVSLALLAP